MPERSLQHKPVRSNDFSVRIKKIKPKSSGNAIELNHFLNSEVRLRSHMAIFVNVNAVRKYNFVDSFLFWFVYKTCAVTIDSKYHYGLFGHEC